MNSCLSLQIDDGIAIITIDVKGETMNTLKDGFADEARDIFSRVKSDSTIKGAVVISGKPDSFIAGADINMISDVQSAEEASDLSRLGHVNMNAIEHCGKPVVAAIHGPCLGGGYELALACHARIVSDDKKTILGLPEVMLGLLPGGGGTQRLPRLIGVAKALDLMLTGRQVKALKAYKMGMVDEIVPQPILLQTAIEKVKGLLNGKKNRPRKLTLQDRLLEKNPVGLSLVFSQALKTVLSKTKGNYPAPIRIIECVKTGLKQGLEKGCALEAKRFGELAVSPESRQLIGIFQASNDLKKESFVEDEQVTARSIKNLGILGGGLMGAGIGFVSLDRADCDVRVKDLNQEGINAARKHIYDQYAKKTKRKSMTRSQANQQMARFSGSTSYDGFAKADLVIEAVFESLDLKRQMVQDIEKNCRRDTIFATNTSSLLVTDIAKGAARPGNVIGMHYFSPVEKMPLLEIIVHEGTDDCVTASAVELGRKQGKTVIVVKDGAGFYVNRILGPYMNEATWLTQEGIPFDQIDKAMLQWGFPVGPIALLDEVGVDVAYKTEANLIHAYGERMKSSGAGEKMIADGRLGKKVKKGIYLYGGKSKEKKIDPEIYKLLDITPNKTMPPEQIAERCILPLVNEAVRCLEEGVIRCARDGDIGAIFGIGFAPFRGGPFRYIDALGADQIVQKLQNLEAKFGERFKPAESLLKKAKTGEKYYS
ncbi:MAG: fatty acid oxidation complex subunit alpha FadJ [SAR324 cluster bacterium]|uniref:enoyl-CoA hydratase n=1 Tax=SAR324 cluster bacterium TaxID=2024889 RepID=A0A2A4T219_9DELT|nr:MAG: fatty acid oxidation complex subunit alpha FadJ [SAR324 cluster bacterium]